MIDGKTCAGIGDAVSVRTIGVTFPMGRLVATPAALDALQAAGQDAEEFLTRHANRDWGSLEDEDRQYNDYAIDNEERLLSAYSLRDNTAIWIITEWDRSATTILLPSDY